MKIKMITLQAGPGGVREPGSEHDVPVAEAEALIAGGYAIKVRSAEPPPLIAASPRTATRARGRKAIKPEPETEPQLPEDGEPPDEEDPEGSA